MPRRSPVLGIVVGLAVLAIVAVPALFTATAAVAGFTGCLIECSEPEPDALVGALWAAVTLVLLSLPVGAGLVAGRVGSARGWLVVLGVALGLIVVYGALQAVI